MRHNEYDLAEAFQRIENELMASMIRNMDRHRAEETEEGYNRYYTDTFLIQNKACGIAINAEAEG